MSVLSINKRRKALSPSKQALLAKRLASSTEYSTVIPRRPNQTSYPLSFAQERLWFLHELEPDSPALNRPLILNLTGILNPKALERALSQIVNRHEALRATYSMVEGQLRQQIKPAQSLCLPVVDLCNIPETERKQDVNAWLVEEAMRPFDLTTNVLRATLLCVAHEEHILALVIHHIAFDAWSAQCLTQELGLCYEAARKGEECPLPDLPIQVGDVAYWQRQQWQGARHEKQITYWQEQLADIALLNLPTDYPRPLQQTYNAGQETLILPKDLVASLQLLSRQENVTLFMILLSTFQILLHRYTSQDDIVVGSLVAGRSQIEVEELIGCFLNTIVLRTDISGNPNFRQLLARVRQMTLGAYANQEVPFEKLVSQLQPERDLSRTPLFQVLFNFEAADDRPDAGQEKTLTIDEVDVTCVATQFDLSVELILKEQNLYCLFAYNDDLFEADTIKRMASHFQTLLEGIVANPEALISDLPLLTVTEFHQIVHEWNDTATDLSGLNTIQALFEQQAERTPNAIALIASDEALKVSGEAAGQDTIINSPTSTFHLTYGELNTKANQLAHYMRAQGVGVNVKHNSMVGLFMDRSTEAIVGILGILKAGVAYVPLDPEYPKARLAFMMQDAGIQLVVTKERLRKSLPTADADIICLDRIEPELERQPQSNPIDQGRADNLAYVTYTSGSTGKPKGVQIEHKSLVNYFTYFQHEYSLGTQDRIIQFSSLSFDTSVEEIFFALATGATLVLRNDEMLASAQNFWAFCQKWGITLIDLPTNYFHEIIAALDNELLVWPERARLVIVGGDKLLAEHLFKWQEHVAGRVPLLNAYGPTETTITVLVSDLTDVGLVNKLSGEVPIGRPIQNVQAYILDQWMNPLPIGIPGELHIGGAGLARGYLNQPELTSQKFVSNPFSIDPNMRLYKTGDLARYWPDGNIEYLGRIDEQVKIRGFRVELGEIETQLLAHVHIKRAVVMVREDTPSDKRLVAYLVVHEAGAHEQGVLYAELRQTLKAQLPSYMIPAAFVVLDEVPLTLNQKVDYRALPIPDMSRQALNNNIVAPRTPVETQLVEIWSELLQIEHIGIHDNFFEMGGHSLLTVRLMMQIEKQFSAAIPLKLFFEGPTIAHIAARLEPDSSSRPQSAHADDVKQNILPPALEQLYNSIGIPSVMRGLRQPSGGRRRYLIHHILQRLPRRLRLSLAHQLTQEPARSRFFKKQCQLINRFLASIETGADRDHALDLSLFYGLLHRYEVKMVQPKSKSDIGEMVEKVQQTCSPMQGVILLHSHHAMSHWFMELNIIEAHIGGVQHLTPQDDPNYATITDMLFTRQVDHARQILQKGGVAQIAADGQHGKGSMPEFAFHGRQRPFMTGFAELALATNALVVPVLVTVDAEGNVNQALGEPLNGGDENMAPSERVEYLVSQYVGVLSQMWAEAPWMVPWYQMERHLAYPSSTES